MRAPRCLSRSCAADGERAFARNFCLTRFFAMRCWRLLDAEKSCLSVRRGPIAVVLMGLTLKNHGLTHDRVALGPARGSKTRV
jgi:hypothetical protein